MTQTKFSEKHMKLEKVLSMFQFQIVLVVHTLGHSISQAYHRNLESIQDAYASDEKIGEIYLKVRDGHSL